MQIPTTHFSRPFIHSFLFALLSAVLATRYFSEVADMATCALVAFALNQLIFELLDNNRRAIWEEKISPWVANRKLATEFIAIFLGIFFASTLTEMVWPGSFSDLSLSRVYKNQFSDLLQHNFGVLFAGVFLASIYRASGLVLVLAWNAVHWAEALFSYAAIVLKDSGVYEALLLFLVLLPHLILEALSYVVAGLAGVFISLAFSKYTIASSEFRRVLRASIILLFVSMLILIVASATEVFFAQPAFHWLGG